MGVFDRQIAQAQRQIAAKGESCLWNVTTDPSAADPAKPWIATDTPGDPIAVNILFLSSQQTGYTIKAGSDIEQQVFKGIMPAVAFTPKLADTVTRSDGTVLQIVKIDSLSPNGQAILYYLDFS